MSDPLDRQASPKTEQGEPARCDPGHARRACRLWRSRTTTRSSGGGASRNARGHEVTVYGRTHFVPEDLMERRGMRLRVLPTRHKYLDTVAHTALSVIDVLPRRFE